MISGAATIAETVEALRLGVFDFIEKPVSREHLLQSLRNALERTRLERQVATLERRLDAQRTGLARVVGQNSLLSECLDVPNHSADAAEFEMVGDFPIGGG